MHHTKYPLILILMFHVLQISEMLPCGVFSVLFVTEFHGSVAQLTCTTYCLMVLVLS